MDNSGKKFRYPSYVQDIMGDVFSLGFGPYRWVCTSGKPEDLALTDQLAHDVLTQQSVSAPPRVKACIEDNIHWIANAGKNKMVHLLALNLSLGTKGWGETHGFPYYFNVLEKSM